jgi:thiamine phosphate synthase YjbQ (UPF0047 family)
VRDAKHAFAGALLNERAHGSRGRGSRSESVPVVDGQLMIGTWQSILLVELDGPRQRTVGVQIMGE